MATHPNGVWIWVLDWIRSDYLNKLVQCKVKRIYLKVFDGRSSPMFWSDQCSKEIIDGFQSKGIQVYGWGYHYGTSDIFNQVTAVKQAMDCGLDGYILDFEEEVKDPSTHPHVDDLLVKLRPLVPTGSLGYTSFGHPLKHPEIPWSILNDRCDLALPQIYFEKFRFRSTNEEEVQECLDAHRSLGLTKPILPIWGSESDSAEPATAGELQRYLRRFPGSSIFRLPNSDERSEAWNLSYDDTPAIVHGGTEGEIKDLPTLLRILRNGSIGDDVKVLQKALNALAFKAGDADGEFGPNTEAAVRRFQRKAGITIDGEVGPETWKALGGKANINLSTRGLLAKLADFAEDEAAKGLSWNGASSEAEKYLNIFRKPMQDLGQIGTAKIFYDWCGAFVTFCCREVSINIPDVPDGFWATLALVESWKFWARGKGYWHPKGTITPKRGDILVFDWDGDGELNHIGIVRGYTPGSNIINTSEGNRQNASGNFTRDMSNVAGFIRIADT